MKNHPLTHRRLDTLKLWKYSVPLAPILIGVSGTLLSWQIGLSDGSNPGPGLYPFLASLLITGSGIALSFNPHSKEIEQGLPNEARTVVVGIVILIVYAISFTMMGVITTSFLTCLVWLKLMGRMRWWTSITVSICAAAAIYIIFIRLLRLPLPLETFLGS